MKTWNSSPHPISDIRDWHGSGRLEIRPAFQRKEVWSFAAKVMLIDTILRSIPMPKVFVSSIIKEMQVHRTVIDGQQRISTILSFLSDDFNLTAPYEGEHYGKHFSELPAPVQAAVLQYRIDFNEAIEFTDEELRETYLRLNKYAVALTKQELRRADFPGSFLTLSEQLASLDYLEESRIFSIANRRRLADVEFISELLAGLIDGPQDKKDTLDNFYLSYANWDPIKEESIKNRFLSVIDDLKKIFQVNLKLPDTRFKQKADFYSLFLAIDELKQLGGSLIDTSMNYLREDLELLDQLIEPESSTRDLRAYAIRCVSQANTIGSRRWRQGFWRSILSGTYQKRPPDGEAAILVGRLFEDFDDDSASIFECPPPNWSCPVCEIEIESGRDNFRVGWLKNEKVFQISNAIHVHEQCLEKEDIYSLSQENLNREPEFPKNPQASDLDHTQVQLGLDDAN